MNNAFSNFIDFNMSEEILDSNDKKLIFKELIIEYLIRNIIGDSNEA